MRQASYVTDRMDPRDTPELVITAETIVLTRRALQRGKSSDCLSEQRQKHTADVIEQNAIALYATEK
uniref:Transposase n=1 Tax=Angiostrongylus cantonensis TaxID=6313 RepID=A0A0K0CVK4_ANGCA